MKTKPSPPTYGQAAVIIAKLGGPRALAAELGINVATCYKWGYGRPRGQDGLIPGAMVEPIEKAAKRLGITLSVEDWAPTRSKKESASEEIPTLESLLA